MKLTKQQIEYAFERIDGIVKQRVKAKAPPEITQKPKVLSDAEKRKQIENGTAKLRKHVGPYTYWTDAFEFDDSVNDSLRAKLKERETKLEAAKKVELKKAQKLKDKIMLSGDADAALKLLDAYAAEE